MHVGKHTALSPAWTSVFAPTSLRGKESHYVWDAHLSCTLLCDFTRDLWHAALSVQAQSIIDGSRATYTALVLLVLHDYWTDFKGLRRKLVISSTLTFTENLPLGSFSSSYKLVEKDKKKSQNTKSTRSVNGFATRSQPHTQLIQSDVRFSFWNHIYVIHTHIKFNCRFQRNSVLLL